MTSKSPTSKSRKISIQAGPTTVAQSGQLLFSDLDTNDSHIVQDTPERRLVPNARKLVRWRTHFAVGESITLTYENAPTARPLRHRTTTATGPSTAISISTRYLAVGESITLTYEITVSDGNGLPATQNPLTVTLTGTNDQPVIDVQIPDFQVQEDLDQAGPTTVAQSGQLLFSDLDTNDSHIVQDTLLNADWSGGALTPAQENALDLFVIDNDGNWSFNGDLDLDFLAVGESITLTYEITVSDGNGLPTPLKTHSPSPSQAPTTSRSLTSKSTTDFQVQEDLDQAGPTTVAQSGQLLSRKIS